MTTNSLLSSLTPLTRLLVHRGRKCTTCIRSDTSHVTFPSLSHGHVEVSAKALLPRLLDARAVAPVLDFSKSSYIWTGEQTGTAHTAPAGMRPFRVEIPSSATKCPHLRDNHRSLVCWLYHSLACTHICPATTSVPSTSMANRSVPGGAPKQGAVVYTAGLNPDSKNVFAIGVNNTAETSAGLIATILVDYTDGTTETIVRRLCVEDAQRRGPWWMDEPEF